MKTVLVVDDEPVLRALFRDILHDAGYRVIEAPGGWAMVEVLAQTRPDLVLLDMMMPAGDGSWALGKLRARPETRELPVVMMSAAMVPDREALGIAGFVRKPFEIDQLVNLVEQLIGPATTERDP